MALCRAKRAAFSAALRGNIFGIDLGSLHTSLVGTTPRTNWLPRHTEGTPAEGGDQFAESTAKRALEGTLMRTAKKVLFGRHFLSKLFVPLKKLGRMVAERAKAKGVEAVVFDRGGYLYHGRVKALADAAREAGLKF